MNIQIGAIWRPFYDQVPIGIMGMDSNRIAEQISKDPAVEVMLRCARPFLRIEDKDAVESILRNPDFDWSRLIDAVEHQHVVPLVSKGLDQVDPELLPDDVRRRFMTSVEEIQAKNQRLARELIRILKVLRAEGITAIPFKGPAMAVLIYGELGLRRFADIDILVRGKDTPKAKRILLANGYQAPSRVPLSREWHFFNDEVAVQIDLHDRITSYRMPDLHDYEMLWRNRRTISLLDNQVECFSTDHTVLMLCMQISKDWHEKRRFLSKICDLSTYLDTQAAIDWSKFLKFSETQGLRRTVLVALFLTQVFHAVQLPHAVRKATEADAFVTSLDVQVEKRLLEVVKRPLPVFEQIWLQMKYYDGFWGKLWRPLVRSVLLRPLMPSEMDEAFLKLPLSLGFLYYVVRPFRIIGRLCLYFLRAVGVR